MSKNTKVWEKQTVVLVYFVVECHELNELNQLGHPPSRLCWNNGSCSGRTPTHFPAIQICRHGMGAQSWKKNGFCLDSSIKGHSSQTLKGPRSWETTTSQANHFEIRGCFAFSCSQIYLVVSHPIYFHETPLVAITDSLISTW